MKTIELFYKNDSASEEIIAQDKGYRSDVFVRYDAKLYQLTVYGKTRLNQDFDDEYEQYGFYAVDPNLIILKSVTTEELFFTIKKMEKQHYFANIKEITGIDVLTLKKVRSAEIDIK